MILPSRVHPQVPEELVVSRYSETSIPTEYGVARMVVFREPCRAGPVAYREHVALVFGAPEASADEVLVRVHSECLTSEVFGSLKCDCRQQLEAALSRMSAKGCGVLIYLRQEGRGIGLGNKIRAYALQAEGADTVEANERLGFEVDLRSYGVAAAMLQDLRVTRVALLTNNPRKIRGLKEHGILVERRAPITVEPTLHSEGYLHTKREKLGHMLELAGQGPDPEDR